MSEATATLKPAVSTTRSNFWTVLIPYAIALAAQLPMLLYYFSELWSRPHYQFFPFALAAVGYFLYVRWPRNETNPFFASTFSAILFWIGIGLGVFGTVFIMAEFTYASFGFLCASLFARTKDGERPSQSLISLSLPLFVIMSPPFGMDFRLITSLQVVSAKISSYYLDLLGFNHHSPGTTLNFANQVYEVERACSGVQSFFTLLFCTSFFIVATRRSWFRGLILLISAGFWAVLMNSVRIMTIPIADIVFGVNLKDGLAHDILGYVVLAIAVGLVLSTDQILMFIMGPPGEMANGDGNRIRRWFKRKFSRNRTRGRISPMFKVAAWAGAGFMSIVGIVQLMDVQRSISQPGLNARFFSKNVIIPVTKSSMPEKIDHTVQDDTYSWEVVDYQIDDRTRGSDLGQRSDSWIFKSNSGFIAFSSLDQAFPGWHELTTCYRNQGWELASPRKRKTAKIKLDDGTEIDWPYIEADLVHPMTAQHGLLLFGFTDSAGRPFEAPIRWSGLTAFVERAKNRLSHEVRSKLFRGEAYQMQVFVETSIDLPEKYKREIRQQFFQVRQHLRSAVMDGAGEMDNPKEITSNDGEQSPAG